MSQSDPKRRHQVQILQEEVNNAWFFDEQTAIPHIGELVTVFDKNGDPLIEGRVADIWWAYVEGSDESSCTVILRPEDK